jgi:hypothetical protein
MLDHLIRHLLESFLMRRRLTMMAMRRRRLMGWRRLTMILMRRRLTRKRRLTRTRPSMRIMVVPRGLKPTWMMVTMKIDWRGPPTLEEQKNLNP